MYTIFCAEFESSEYLYDFRIANNLVDFWRSSSTPNLRHSNTPSPKLQMNGKIELSRKMSDRSSRSKRSLSPRDSSADITSLYPFYVNLPSESKPSLHILKMEVQKRQSFVRDACSLIESGEELKIIEGLEKIAQLMHDVWNVLRIGDDIAYGLCEFLREIKALDEMIELFENENNSLWLRTAAGHALEECMSEANISYMYNSGSLSHLITNAIKLAKSAQTEEAWRLSVTLIEAGFRLSEKVSFSLIRLGALDHVLHAVKRCREPIFRHAALALANLAVYSDANVRQEMVSKNVQDWLFMVASTNDAIARYYACLAICVLTTHTEIEAAVLRSGTLKLVEPFLLQRPPEQLAETDYKHSKYRPKEWLRKLLPLLNSKRKEAQSLAAYHFAMEAGIKSQEEETQIFQEIGAIEALKQVASNPDELAPKFARQALQIIGEEIPHKLSQQVPLWNVQDVTHWVSQVGFSSHASAFEENMVDGDVLLLITDEQLKEDVGIKSSLQRQRFLRELTDLKIAADYSCIDETDVDKFLSNINPYFSAYSYRLIQLGIDKTLLSLLTDETLSGFCRIENPFHRLKILEVAKEWLAEDHADSKLLEKQVDVFISYRRSTGSQLASLIRTMLQLRGYRVFFDVDRLSAGAFDSSLLRNIKVAKHFLIILTPNALDRCLDDDSVQDWVHKELLCAIQNNRNIIPIVDPLFNWPNEDRIPKDMRAIQRFNAIQWVHEYQEACIDKLERFMGGNFDTISMSNGPTNKPDFVSWITNNDGSATPQFEQ